MNEGTMNQSTKVQILGQTYTIGGGLEEAYVRKLAAYVDEKMQAISEATSTVDTQKVAIFAALAIADDLHRLRKANGEHEELLKEQAERCLTLVERALKQSE
jgi:cell division protein ZapA